MRESSICLICLKPNDIWINFLSGFSSYDIYIIVDDNSKDYSKEYSINEKIKIVQISDKECKDSGYIKMSYLMIKKLVSGWDKSIYYFSKMNIGYKNVWFIEDDVFLHDERCLLEIDSKYKNSDLLSNIYSENGSGEKKDWHWKSIEIKHNPPYYNAMVCSVRISSNLLCKIKDYATEHKTLFFLEALFPTICKINSMRYDTPSELKNIVYKREYKDIDIDKNSLYHPVKDISKHKYYREMLNKKG
jgi:hypothetical protein